MKDLYCSTSINGDTDFSIAIAEEFGWIEPVFLLISPSLRKILRLNKEPIFLAQIKHFEIINCGDTYALNFFNSDNSLIKENNSDLIIRRANHITRYEYETGKMYSIFEYSHKFTEVSQYLEYCFLFKANGISYLTNFNAFAVDDYEYIVPE